MSKLRWKIHHQLCCYWQTSEWAYPGQNVRNWLRFRVWLLWRWFSYRIFDDGRYNYEILRDWYMHRKKLKTQKARHLMIDALLAERTEARRQRDFAKADNIRQQLAAMGVTVKDEKL